MIWSTFVKNLLNLRPRIYSRLPCLRSNLVCVHACERVFIPLLLHKLILNDEINSTMPNEYNSDNPIRCFRYFHTYNISNSNIYIYTSAITFSHSYTLSIERIRLLCAYDCELIMRVSGSRLVIVSVCAYYSTVFTWWLWRSGIKNSS